MDKGLVKCIHCGRIDSLNDSLNGAMLIYTALSSAGPRCPECSARIIKIIETVLENLKQNKETK